MSKYAHDAVLPDAKSKFGKRQQVEEMFNNIAFRYDFLNRFLSIGIDISWRKTALKQLIPVQPKNLLDVATGTGDMMILGEKILHPAKMTGIDISAGMLEWADKKLKKSDLQHKTKLIQADSENLPFENNSFDAVTVAFGVRNFENLQKGLKEIYRVLQPGGKLVVIEATVPKSPVIRAFHKLYMYKIAPAFGKLFAKNKEAYSYLNNSVQAFPQGQTFLNILHEAEFTQTYLQTLSLGICTIYCGSK